MSGEPTSLHTKKNLGGRPPERGESKRSPISMRTTPTIRAALEEAAEQGGRSLAQEIEQRLERSFERETEVGGRRTQNFLRRVAATIVDLEERIGSAWHESPVAYYAVREAIPRIVSEYRPALPSEAALSDAMRAMESEAAASRAAMSPAILSLITAGQRAERPTSDNGGVVIEETPAMKAVKELLAPLIDAQAEGHRFASEALAKKA